MRAELLFEEAPQKGPSARDPTFLRRDKYHIWDLQAILYRLDWKAAVDGTRAGALTISAISAYRGFFVLPSFTTCRIHLEIL